jgi:uncharacterized protein (TIGR00725 family)
MLTTIGIIGRGMQHEHDPVDPTVMESARLVGRLVAERGGVIVSGGLGGVMEAASRGAKEAGGLTLGFLPSMDKSTGNAFLDIVLPTGLGRARNLITARGCDAIVMIARSSYSAAPAGGPIVSNRCFMTAITSTTARRFRSISPIPRRRWSTWPLPGREQ